MKRVRLREVVGEIGGASLVMLPVDEPLHGGLVQLAVHQLFELRKLRGVGLDRLALHLPVPRLLPRLLIQVTERVEVVFAEPDVLSRPLGLVNDIV